MNDNPKMKLMSPANAYQCLIDEFGSIENAYSELQNGSDFPGLCWHCGAIAYGVEPDASRYECEECGEKAVYGVEETIVMTVA